MVKKFKQFKGVVFFTYLRIAFWIRLLTNQSIYHVIGDSHTTSFLHPAFIIHHIGPATAYKLNFKDSTTRSRDKVYKIFEQIYKDKVLNVIFVFGELDTRIHINKTAQQGKLPLNTVISSTVKSYFNFLIELRTKYPLISIYIFNVLPQGEEENIYNFPHYADRATRSSIALLMNNKLKVYAKKTNIKFIYIFNQLIDKKGNRKKEYIFDKVHFNRKIMKFIVKELKSI